MNIIYTVYEKTELLHFTSQLQILSSSNTRRMAIANGTCVSFCNQPKAQFGYLGRITPDAGMSLPSPVLRVEAFGYVKRV